MQNHHGLVGFGAAGIADDLEIDEPLAAAISLLMERDEGGDGIAGGKRAGIGGGLDAVQGDGQRFGGGPQFRKGRDRFEAGKEVGGRFSGTTSRRQQQEQEEEKPSHWNLGASMVGHGRNCFRDAGQAKV